MKLPSAVFVAVAIILANVAFAQDVLLRTNDVIIISISGVPVEEQDQINKQYPINERGQVRLPYIEALSAAGLRADALAQKIESAYRQKEIFSGPLVTVSTPEDVAIQRRITVMGEVSGPGIQQYMNNMTILEAIAQAGNPTPYANMKEVKLMRGGKTFSLDLRKAPDQSERDIQLEPGDKIMITEWSGLAGPAVAGISWPPPIAAPTPRTQGRVYSEHRRPSYIWSPVLVWRQFDASPAIQRFFLLTR